MSRYKYCPYCKGDLTFTDFEYKCRSCNSKVYINPAPCVSVIPIKDGKILLCKRGVEPRKGTYDFIGGFVNVGETVKEAAVRETFEETGLKIKLNDFIGVYDEIYREGVTYPKCFTYTADIISGKTKAGDDVEKLEWINVKEIKKLDLSGSFPTIKTVLSKVLKMHKIKPKEK